MKGLWSQLAVGLLGRLAGTFPQEGGSCEPQKAPRRLPPYDERLRLCRRVGGSLLVLCPRHADELDEEVVDVKVDGDEVDLEFDHCSACADEADEAAVLRARARSLQVEADINAQYAQIPAADLARMEAAEQKRARKAARRLAELGRTGRS